MKGRFPISTLEGLLDGLDEGGLLVRNGRNCPRERDVKMMTVEIVFVRRAGGRDGV
jgi:hypothetical protein